MKLLLDYLINLGCRHNLTISNQEILKCSMMGLDDADILIYKRTDNDLRELPELELKARKWMELLSENLPISLNEKLPLKL